MSNQTKTHRNDNDGTVYMPNLFNRSEEVHSTIENKEVIPQNTYYDLGMAVQHTVEKRHVCVFGVSSGNRKDVVTKIKSMVNARRIEEGPNYLNVFCDEMEDLEKLVTLNLSKINGEIIGVYRKNCGIVQNSDIYAPRKGIFTQIREYLFGASRE